MQGFIRTYADAGNRMQDTFDVAVVMPSLLRPQLREALRSIFTQDLAGRIRCSLVSTRSRVIIHYLKSVCNQRPTNCTVQVFYRVTLPPAGMAVLSGI